MNREETVASTIDEHFRLEYNIIDTPIAAGDLRVGMVLTFGGKLRVVISLRYKKNTVLVETGAGINRLNCTTLIPVWHMNGKPFLMILPPEFSPLHVTEPSQGGGSAPPAQDAAGIVPVWRGPTRPN